MANVNKTSFSVSVTPKVQMDLVDGITVARDVINENIRRNIGGSGEITGNDTVIDDKDNSGSSDGGWSNGVFTAVTSDGTEYVVTYDNNLIFFKHTGLLFGTTTASAAADTVKIGIHGDDTNNVDGDGVLIAEIANGEAFLLPRPASTLTWKLSSTTSNHVGVEVLSVGTLNMGNTNKIAWAVSVTPKIKMDLVDGVNQEKEVLNENVRRKLGGVGELIAANNDTKINTSSASATNGVDNAGSTEGTSGWTNGTYGYVTSNATTIAVNVGTDFVVIKNSGFEYDSSATNNISTTTGTAGTDMVFIGIDGSATTNVAGDTVLLAVLDIGEAMVIPRPASTYGLLLTSSSSHMACEVTVFGTNVGD